MKKDPHPFDPFFDLIRFNVPQAHKLDAWLKYIGSPGFSVSSTHHRSAWHRWQKFKKLSIGARQQTLAEYLDRKPILTAEQQHEKSMAMLPAVCRAFGIDYNSPGSNFYDADDASYRLDPGDGDKLVWRSVPPGAPRIIVGLTLDEHDAERRIVHALIALTVRMGRAHLVKSIGGNLVKHFHTVLAPHGVPTEMEGTHLTLNVGGLDANTYLAFAKPPEETGMVMVHRKRHDQPEGQQFGLVLFSIPRAIRLMRTAFHEDPTLAATL